MASGGLVLLEVARVHLYSAVATTTAQGVGGSSVFDGVLTATIG
jgi:hypothetical protein